MQCVKLHGHLCVLDLRTREMNQTGISSNPGVLADLDHPREFGPPFISVEANQLIVLWK